MRKFIKFPSIEQFRTIASNICASANYLGKDENGKAIYDETLSKPTLTFEGTVKLHGTNAGVCYNNPSGMWMQSRSNIITPEHDNAGFAFFVESVKEDFLQLFQEIQQKYSIDLDENTISIYGEWCGGNIQKNVGICNLPKSFFIFGIKVTPFDNMNDDDEAQITLSPAYWVDSSSFRCNSSKIYNIHDYQKFSIEIDFNYPMLSQNKMLEWTLDVENECPVAKAFGFLNTIGEGIVWTCLYKGSRYIFKTKGEKHAGSSKVKTIKAVDENKITNVIEAAQKVTPIWRLQQALESACDFMNGGKIERKKMGDFLRFVHQDILKEEMQTLIDFGLEPKDINGEVSKIAKEYFFEQEKELSI